MSAPMDSDRGWPMLSRPYLHTLAGAILAFWAGTINTITTLTIMFERSSHISGRLNDVGMNLVLEPIDSLLVFTIWISFVFGGYLAGLALDNMGFTRSLFLIAPPIGLTALLVSRGIYAPYEYDYGLGRMIIATILPIAMGYQNGLTSQLPRIGRSTHWTGNSTDIGVALARGNFTLAAHNTTKIFWFCAGCALMGYIIGIQNTSPAYGLVVVAIGYFVSSVFLHYVDRVVSKQ